MAKKAKRMRKHWYRIYLGECPVCGRQMGWRERVYGVKPKSFSLRYVYLTDAECYDGCLG
jgi:hypothetical protein